MNLGFVSELTGQVSVQVITQTLNGEVPWEDGMKLEINGENAEIYCISHKEYSIVWEVQLIAKHPDKAIAKDDLEMLKLVTGEIGKKLLLRNYVEVENSNSRPESNLKAIYQIKIPEDCPLIINNYFGKISLERITGKLDVSSEFASINMKNISGRTKIESNLGDISADSIAGWFDIVSKRSNISMTNISGTQNINASLAKIELDQLNKITSFRLEAEKSEVVFNTVNKFRWMLDLDNIEFNQPEWMQVSITGSPGKTMEVNFTEMPEAPLLQVSLNIGTLEIK